MKRGVDMDKYINFSFIALLENDFNFIIYRRSPDEYMKNDDEYIYNLPLSKEHVDVRDKYVISFSEREGFSSFNCNSFDNISLTKKWLVNLLTSRVKVVYNSDEYFIGQHFIPRISFFINTFKEGCQVVSMEPYYLESKKSFGFILEFGFRANKGYEKTQREKVLSLSIKSTGEKNKDFYSDKLKFINSFIQKQISNIFPISFETFNIDVERHLSAMTYELLKEKMYVFKDGELSNQFQGIKDLKPLSPVQKKPLFVFVFEESKVNIARELVKALRGETYTTFSGMDKMFGVQFSNENIQSIQVNQFTKESLTYIENQLNNLIDTYFDRQLVGIFAGISKDFDTNSDFSPYYTTKNIFLKKGLAIQAVTIEQALKRDGFKWSISGIGLQLFVKLGGRPWKVKPQNTDCLILGISCAHIIEDHKIKKYFAYSVCFDSSGIYKELDILSKADNEKTYIEQLSQQIKLQLEDKLNQNVKKCAIHLPFKIKRNEMRCIIDSVNSLRTIHNDVEFVFIKINTDNRFFGYSTFNSKVPIAGSYITLANRQFLVWFEGLQQEHEQLVSAQNISNPVHIEFLYAPELTDEKIKNYLQDVINLSGANWRGFNAKHVPVTIYYPELIAKFAGKFEQYHLDMIIGPAAADKAWFV